MNSASRSGNTGGGTGLVGKMINCIISMLIIMRSMRYGGSNVKDVE